MKRLVVIFRWHYVTLLAVLGFVVVLASLTNVSTKVQPEDTVAIKAILAVLNRPGFRGGQLV